MGATCSGNLRIKENKGYFLNRQHPYIKFTAELEKDNSTSFLDVKINKTEQSFDAEVFRKGTFTG